MLKRHALLALSIVLVLGGVWVLNGACAFAMLNAPPPEEVPAYRALFYQRAMLGIGCIILGVVVLKWRHARQSDGEAREGSAAARGDDSGTAASHDP